MKREFRLTKSTDFERVRRSGKSFAHPLVVLVASPNQRGTTRFGVAAGKRVGSAVKRNRAKRLIRAALMPLVAEISPGWDIVILARTPLAAADVHKTGAALQQLLKRANLLTRTTSPEQLETNE